MNTTEQDLVSFTSFAQRMISSGHRELSLEELFDQWRAENPSDESYADNLAAINASLEDYKRGERGTIAGEHSAQLRRQYGMPSE